MTGQISPTDANNTDGEETETNSLRAEIMRLMALNQTLQSELNEAMREIERLRSASVE